MQKGKKTNPLKDILFLLVFLAGIYLVGFLYAGSFFLPRSYINGVNVSFLSADAANSALVGEGPKLQITQRSKDGKESITETINLMESGVGGMVFDTELLIKAQDRVLWFKSFFQPNDINNLEAEGKFDVVKLEEEIDKLYSLQKENTVMPKDASLKANAGRIIMEPEVEGTQVDKEKAYALIKDAAGKAIKGEGLQKVDMEEAYVQPSIRASNPLLIKAQEDLGRIISKSISILVSGEMGETITGAEIMDLIKLNGYEYSADNNKIKAFVSDLASQYNISRYEYVLEEDLVESIKKVLMEDENQSVTANWYNNYPTPGSRGNGSPSFIEVSIGKQHMWYYENGEEILSSDIVTGNPDSEEPTFITPTGYFEIVCKLRDTHLIGDDYDVEVKYWMGFEYSGYYGFHDAPTRTSFGGNIYTYAPSHGCVNLPEPIAAALYERVSIGDTEVYIYDIPEDHLPVEDPDDEEKAEEDKDKEEGSKEEGEEEESGEAPEESQDGQDSSETSETSEDSEASVTPETPENSDEEGFDEETGE